MSSFRNPHHLFCFTLKNGKKKLAYGATPADALEILAYRLPPEEMAEILPDRYVQINQRDLHKYLDQLG